MLGGEVNTFRYRTDLKHVFEVDVLAVHTVTSAFIPLLEKGELKKVVNISTAMGSITQAPTYKFTPTPAYKIAKAALNMLTVQWHLAKYDDGFSFIALQPGVSLSLPSRSLTVH
jgi:NAD(P)-dependent dehydrogenase (short-subunit alcohol dehydrogenase family)